MNEPEDRENRLEKSYIKKKRSIIEINCLTFKIITSFLQIWNNEMYKIANHLLEASSDIWPEGTIISTFRGCWMIPDQTNRPTHSIWKNVFFLLDIVLLYMDVHHRMVGTTWKGVEHLQTKEFCLRANFHAKWTIFQIQVVGHLFNQKYKCLTILESLRGGLSHGPTRFFM